MKCSLSSLNTTELRRALRPVFRQKSQLNSQELLSKVKEVSGNMYDFNTRGNAADADPLVNYIYDMLLDYEVYTEGGTIYSKQDIYNTLYNSSTNTSTEAEEDVRISLVEGEESAPKMKLLASRYGSATTVVNLMLQEFRVALSDIVILQVGYGNDPTSEISRYLEELWNNIVDYLPALKLPEFSQIKDLCGLSIFKRLSENILKELTNNFTITGSIILARYDRLSVPKNAKFIQAYNSLFILLNFDRLVKDVYGNAVSISEADAGLFSNAPNKYKFTAANELTNSWRTNEYVSFVDELDNQTKSIVETTPLYNIAELRIIGGYLLINQYTSIFSKIRNLLHSGWSRSVNLNPYIKKLLRTSSLTDTRIDILSTLEKLYITDQGFNTLYDLIAHARVDSQKIYPIIFKILVNYNGRIDSFYSLDRMYLFSIYKRLFSPDATILPDNEYYSYLTKSASTISPILYYLDYVDEDGSIKSRALAQTATDVSKSTIERTINSSYSRLSPERFLNIKTNYLVSIANTTTGHLLNLEVPTSKGKPLQVAYNPKFRSVEVTINGKTIYKSRDKEYTVESIAGYSDFIFNTFLEVLGLPVSDTFTDTLIQVYGNENVAVNDVLLFTADILNNAWFTHEYIPSEVLSKIEKSNAKEVELAKKEGREPILEDISAYSKFYDKNALEQAKTEYFGADSDTVKIAFLRGSSEYSIFNGVYTSTLDKVATAYSIDRGLYNKGTVRDSEGNDMGATSMSRLFEGVDYLLSRLRKDSALKDMGILKYNLVPQVVVHKEISEIGDYIEFSPSEMFYTSLIADFYGKLVDPKEDSFMIHPMVVSDKSMVLKALTNKEQFVKLIRDLNNLLDLNFDTITLDHLDTAIKKTFGPVYKNILENVLKDFDKLAQFINLSTPVVFNIYDDFKSFNELFGDRAVEVLHEFIKLYQLLYPHDTLEFIEEIHYVNVRGKLSVNRTLISQLVRFLPNDSTALKFLQSLEQGLAFTNQIFTDYDTFRRNKEYSLINDMLLNGFEIDLDLSHQGLVQFRSLTDWIDTSVNKAILAKATVIDSQGNTKVIPIRTKFDMPTDGSVSYELNPAIRKFNSIQYFISQLVIYTHMGIPAVNPSKLSKKYFSNQMLDDNSEEGERFTAATKRNVTETGSMDLYMLGLFEGLPDVVNMAVIEDPKEPMYSFAGDGAKGDQAAGVMDGGMYTIGPTLYLQNNSLRGSKAGYTQKPLFHDINPRFGSGIIVKAASFPVNNYTCKNSEFHKNLMRKGLSEIPHPRGINLTQDYSGNKLDWVAYEQLSEGVYIKRSNLTFEASNPGMYSYLEDIVNQFGEVIRSEGSKNVVIYNNYDFYLWLGGEKSADFLYTAENPDGVLSIEGELGEKSVRDLTKAICYVGEGLPLKSAYIHYMPTKGAVKKGTANINPTSAFTDDTALTHQKVHLGYAGILLDKTHEVEGAKLSILTQVINALTSRGYTGVLATEVYNAIQAASQEAIGPYLDAYTNLLLGDELAKELLQKFVTDIVTKNLMSGQLNTSLIQSIIKELAEYRERGFNIRELGLRIPLSDPAIYNKLVSTIISHINTIAIKLKFDGILAVLTPSHGIFKIFNGKLLEDFNRIEDLIKELQKTPFIRSHKLLIGTLYRYKKSEDADDWEYVTIKSPEDLWNIRNNLKDYYFLEVLVRLNPVTRYIPGKTYVDMNSGEVIKHLNGIIYDSSRDLREVQPVGRDLHAYNVSFEYLDENGEVQQCSMWDLDIVHLMYWAEKAGNTVLVNQLRKQFLTVLQNLMDGKEVDIQLLDAMADNEISLNYVATVIPQNIETAAYENILPFKFEKEFGLERGVRLKDVTELYFIDKLSKSYETVANPSNYDIAIMKLNGNHTYLMDKSLHDRVTLSRLDMDYRTNEAGEIYTVDIYGNLQYKLSSVNDVLYKDSMGNVIIATDNVNFYLDNEDGFAYRVSKKVKNFEYIKEILQNSQSSKSYIESILEEAITKENFHKLTQDISKSKYIQGKIKREAKTKFISFNLALKTLAARIPAQSMQSFMAMKCVGFDRTGLNNVYVNAYQIWLQGSDFDIDSVSMLGYSFNRDGKFLHWSSEANFTSLELFDASLTLPFPTGKNTEVVAQDNSPVVGDGITAMLVNCGAIIEYLKNKKERSLTPDHIKNLSKAIRYFNDNPIAELYITEEWYFEVIDLINRHNAYINKQKSTGHRNVSNIIKNFVSHNAYDISINPLNVIQSQSSVDSMTAVAKAIANNTEKAKNTTRNLPGNSFNYALEQSTNTTGKTVTGITAAAMKALLGITHATNLALNTADPSEIVNVTFNKLVGSITYTIAANSYSHRLDNQVVLDALYNVKNDEDAILVLSALLSLSTDNAKELVLDKINAGLELVALYISGINLGIPFYKISEILISPTINTIATMMKGNRLLGKKGFTRFDHVVRYVEQGPRLSEFLQEDAYLVYKAWFDTMSEFNPAFSRYDEDTLKMLGFNVPKLHTNLRGEIETSITSKKVAINLAHPDVPWNQVNSLGLSFSQVFLSKLGTISNKSSDSAAVLWNRMVEEIRDWTYLKQMTITDTTPDGDNVWNSALSLFTASAEITNILRIFKINLGMDTTSVDLLSYRQRLEDVFTSRMNLINNLHPQKALKFLSAEVVFDTTTIDRDLLALLEDTIEQLPTGQTVGKVSRKKIFEVFEKIRHDKGIYGQYRIGYDQFFNDPVYRNQIINLYNLIKDCHNVPYIIYNNLHYRGYMQSVTVGHAMLGASSKKFEIVSKKASMVADFYNAYSQEDRQRIFREVEKVVDSYIINNWLLQTQQPIIVPEGVSIVDSRFKSFVTTADTPIILGTRWGNQAFKRFMETKVIPDLKKGILGPRTTINLGNSFIQALTPIVIDRTVSKNAILAFSLPINMLPSSALEDSQYAMYKDSMKSLRNYAYYGTPILDLFYLYNMVVYNNKQTSNSFTNLFGDLALDHALEMLRNYFRYVEDFDTYADVDKDVSLYRLKRECAPVESIRTSMKPFVIDYDYTKLKYRLYERRNWEYSKSDYKLSANHKTPDGSLMKNSVVEDGVIKPSTVRLSKDFKIKVAVVNGVPSVHSVIDSMGNEWVLLKNADETTNTILENAIAAYNTRVPEDFQIKNISDLLVIKAVSFADGKNPFKCVDIQTTAANIERLFNNPC